jgi:hypothetical protein
MTKISNGGERGMVYFLSPNIFQKYLNYVSWQKNHTELANGVWWCFFVARCISKIFELLFLAKKQQWEDRGVGYGIFFVARYISKIFELLFLAKKQQ